MPKTECWIGIRGYFGPMLTLAKTLSSWQEKIACMWRLSKNSGINECFYRKMTLIQRCGYGFRNFDNDRLRVIAHWGRPPSPQLQSNLPSPNFGVDP